MFYNYELKDNFINNLIEKKKTSYKLYNKIFNSSARLEEKLKKDLCSFTKEDLTIFYNELAKNIKNITIINYNFLVKDYKMYCDKTAHIENVSMDILQSKDIKNIKSDKEYTILNDEEFNKLMSIAPENSEMNIILVLRTIWETDARPKFCDILKLKISDIDKENEVAYINNISYKLSKGLIDKIIEWANTTEIDVWNRGMYKLASMDENNGYVFRKIKSSKTKLGIPMSLVNFDNSLYAWGLKYLQGDVLTVKDIYMSLALKYMLINRKTHTEMFTEQRYFQKTLSFVYQNLFNKYAKVKYPALYDEYANYFVELGKKYNYCV
jgi:integrase